MNVFKVFTNFSREKRIYFISQNIFKKIKLNFIMKERIGRDVGEIKN
jgi:hypothetical protein